MATVISSPKDQFPATEMKTKMTTRDLTYTEPVVDWESDVDRERICGLKVARATMRYLLGLPATRLKASFDPGLCEGPEKKMSAENALLIAVAGTAWEVSLNVHLVRLEEIHLPEFDAARYIVSQCPYLRNRVDGVKDARLECVNATVRRYLFKAFEMLLSHGCEIEWLSRKLDDVGELSARQVAVFMRHSIGRLREWKQSQEDTHSNE